MIGAHFGEIGLPLHPKGIQVLDEHFSLMHQLMLIGIGVAVEASKWIGFTKAHPIHT
jgi:hypothetical protein